LLTDETSQVSKQSGKMLQHPKSAHISGGRVTTQMRSDIWRVAFNKFVLRSKEPTRPRSGSIFYGRPME